MKLSRHLLAPPLLALLALSIGCESRLTGNEGNLEFSYPAHNRPFDFNKPIAVGAMLEVKVAQAVTRRRVEVQSAATDDEGVLSVTSFSGDNFILRGEGEGNALVSVTARVPSGDVLPDSINMMARVPQVLKMAHSCTSEPDAHYLIDHDVRVGFELAMSNGQPVIGYGYYPIEIEPEDAVALDLTSKDQAFMHLHTGQTPGLVTLSSLIDTTEATMTLVERADVDGCRTSTEHQGPAVVGLERPFHVVPTTDGHPVCQAVMTLTVESETPDVCSVALASDSLGIDVLDERGWIRLTPHAAGTCEFVAEFTEGTEAVERFSVEVVDA